MGSHRVPGTMLAAKNVIKYSETKTSESSVYPVNFFEK